MIVGPERFDIKRLLVFLVLVSMAPSANASSLQSEAVPGVSPVGAFVQLEAANWTCNRRKLCSRISSCEEAMWYLQNCSWGYKLDGDSRGKPCENLCGQDN